MSSEFGFAPPGGEFCVSPCDNPFSLLGVHPYLSLDAVSSPNCPKLGPFPRGHLQSEESLWSQGLLVGRRLVLVLVRLLLRLTGIPGDGPFGKTKAEGTGLGAGNIESGSAS